MNGRTLLVMAGYPGVGKSTLLARALKQRIPLFGEEFDPLFRCVRVPPVADERRMSAHSVARHGTWFNLTHLPDLWQMAQPPAVVALHCDLVTALGLGLKSGGTAAEPGAMRERLRTVLSLPFFTAFRTVVVNTVFAPWDVTATQWLERNRRGGRGESSREWLFEDTPRNRRTYELAYETWLEAVDELSPARSLFTNLAGGVVAIKVVPESGGRPRRWTLPQQ